MFEARHHPLLPKHQFIKRVARSAFFALLLIGASLYIGMVGYHYFESLGWVDAYVNAAMILSGMGPVQELKTEEGKIFAGSYALFSGIVFLFGIAIILAPVFHRFLHQFHIEESTKKE